MSYLNERKVLNNWAQGKSFWGLIPFALDVDDNVNLNAKADAGFSNVISGEPFQSSIGNSRNKARYPSIYNVIFWKEGGTGQAVAKEFADTIITDLTNLKLDQDGNPPSTSSTITYRFGDNGLLPYIADMKTEGGLIRVRVAAAFVRTQLTP